MFWLGAQLDMAWFPEVSLSAYTVETRVSQ